MVGFGTFKSAEFVRFVTINADNQKEDIINFFKTLEQFVEQHQQELVQPETAKT
jgi:sulfinoalanine decarboxylase/sulfinoalanine decarboxylase/aspartate 1-decarboxylase